MSATQDKLLRVYAKASGGDPEAYAWLLAFHGWAHAIDDYLDEPGHLPPEIVGLCAQGVVVCSCGFYRRHAEALGPLLAIVAEQYMASLWVPNPRMSDCLRLAGNQVVLMVAYLRGGASLCNQVSRDLWPIVTATQLAEDGDRTSQPDRAR